MANYLLLYSGGSAPAGDAERAKSLQTWGAWFGKLGAAVVDGGNPFSGKSKTIGKDGKASDGDGGMMHNGYSILKADSLDAAVELGKGCPVLQSGGKLTVYEVHKAM